jgi:hypothetical protein
MDGINARGANLKRKHSRGTKTQQCNSGMQDALSISVTDIMHAAGFIRFGTSIKASMNTAYLA